MEKAKEILNNSLPFLKEAGKYSLSATVKVLVTLIVFSAINLFLVIFGFYYFTNKDYSNIRLYLILSMILIALISTFFACLKMYNYVLIDAAKVFFGTIDDFKRKIAEKFVNRFEEGINDTSTQKTKLNQIINVADIATDLYGKVPNFVIKIFSFIVGKIPLMDFSTEVKQHIVSGNKEEGINYFVSKTNEFFKENIFDKNNTRIVYITLLLNVILQFTHIHFLKK